MSRAVSYCILHKECKGCAEGVMYSARFYSEPVDLHTPFQLLPRYIGSCSLRMLGTTVYISRMMFIEGAKFENKHHLDLCLRLLEAEPSLETASFERHKQDCEIRRTVRIVDRVRFLSRPNKPAH